MNGDTHLGSNLTLTQQLGHQPILDITEPSTLAKVVLGQEHIPQTQLLGLLLQRLHDSGRSLPSLLALAQLGGEDGVGGDAVFLDEFLDLFSE